MASHKDRLGLAVLISGRGSNLKSLIDHFGPGTNASPIEIRLVISNRREAAGLGHAIAAGIPHVVIEQERPGTRREFDLAMDQALRKAGVEFLALAGFMRIIGDEFNEGWLDRMVNIHPSLLPAFKGLDTHRRALEAGVRFHGCTVHFVRPELDAGPILAQAVVPVLPGDDVASLAARVLKAEHRLYPDALRLIAERRVRVGDGIVHIDGSAFTDGLWFNPLGS